ncbi:hypothetical protein [Pseudosulfitobacter sp. SM2401]|uniref:calcium-binding protein n=1 Tax=Pseudosulfitobacter sp. SM2401 TaxID=3350098 RepID=UPI0036F3D36D
MDALSNKITGLIFDEVIGGAEATFTIPPIALLAENDATPAANDLFNGDPGGWAGNPLFMGLGYSRSFTNNIIENESDTYDALAMIKFTREGVGIDLSLSAFNRFIDGEINSATAVGAITELNTFFTAAYGFTGGSFVTYAALSNIYLGRLNAEDIIFGSENNDVIHGSVGNDFIVGTLGNDLLDGGQGLDDVSFESEAIHNHTALHPSTIESFPLREQVTR